METGSIPQFWCNISHTWMFLCFRRTELLYNEQIMEKQHATMVPQQMLYTFHEQGVQIKQHFLKLVFSVRNESISIDTSVTIRFSVSIRTQEPIWTLPVQLSTPKPAASRKGISATLTLLIKAPGVWPTSRRQWRQQVTQEWPVRQVALL